MTNDTEQDQKAECGGIRAWPQFIPVLAVMLVLGGCASSGTGVASEPAANTTSGTAVDIPQSNTPLGKIVYDERTRRDCSSKKQRTGSRIARNDCETGVYGKAYHMESGSDAADPAVIDPR